MKSMKRILYVPLLTIIFGYMAACSKIVEGLNENPNLPSSASSDLILTGLQVGAITLHSGELTRDAGLWSGYFTGVDRQYFGFYNYLVLNSDFNTHWANAFRVIRNTVVLEETLQEENRAGIILGIGKVMRAHTFGMAASLWGDIPFREAGRYAVYNNPSYESQLNVYAGVQTLLDEAIAELASPIGRPVAGADIFFNGDPDAWTRVAHALKARFYLHTKEYDKAYDHALLGITSPAHAWVAKFMDANGAQNLYFQFYNGNRADDLQTNGSYFFDIMSPTGVSYRGNAKTNETARFNYLVRQRNPVQFVNNTMANGAFSVTAPYPLMSYEENMLILAESAFRTTGFADGLAHLNELRTYYRTGAHIGAAHHAAGFQYDNYVAADFELGGMANVQGLNRDESLLMNILEEKFVVLYSQLESYNDYRRTFNETVALPIPPNTGSRVPQRFIYPQTELDRNPNKPEHIPGIYEQTPVNQ